MPPVGRGSRHWLGFLLAACVCFLPACGGEDAPTLPAAESGQGGADSGSDDLAGGKARTDREAGEEGDQPQARDADGDGARSGTRERPSPDEDRGRRQPDDQMPDGERDADPPVEGDDEPRVRAFLEDYVARYARGDGSICTEVFTRRHVEALTGRKGDAAVDKCRDDISRQRRPFRLAELKSVDRLDEGRLRVVAILALGNRGYRSVLELLQADGRLRIDMAG